MPTLSLPPTDSWKKLTSARSLAFANDVLFAMHHTGSFLGWNMDMREGSVWARMKPYTPQTAIFVAALSALYGSIARGSLGVEWDALQQHDFAEDWPATKPTLKVHTLSTTEPHSFLELALSRITDPNPLSLEDALLHILPLRKARASWAKDLNCPRAAGNFQGDPLERIAIASSISSDFANLHIRADDTEAAWVLHHVETSVYSHAVQWCSPRTRWREWLLLEPTWHHNS